MCGRVVWRVRVVVITVALCEAGGVEASIHGGQVVVATQMVLMLVEAGHTVRASKWTRGRWVGDGAVTATLEKVWSGRPAEKGGGSRELRPSRASWHSAVWAARQQGRELGAELCAGELAGMDGSGGQGRLSVGLSVCLRGRSLGKVRHWRTDRLTDWENCDV